MMAGAPAASEEQIARRNMRDPIRVQVGRRSAPAERAEQQLFKVNDRDKTPLLLQLLRESEGRVLVFVRTKVGVDRLARVVRSRGFNIARLHSNRAQAERDEAMAGFRDGTYRILIATDIAARGLDVANIEHVINYDFPHAAEDYVHRIGRTARVAARGLATTFVTRSDVRYLHALERLLGESLPLKNPDGSETEIARPRPKPRGGRSRGRRPKPRSRRRSGHSRSQS